jgi:queuosine precursor transporter
MWVFAYIVAIVGLNWLFVVLPPIATRFGTLYLATFIVGAVFVLRDYAQRQIGHYVLLATLFAGVLTWFMVDPALAVASITAFAISEMADWAIYSFTRRPLQQRILVSSLVSVPLDTFAFLYLSGFLTPASAATEMLSKAVGVMIVWYLLKLRTGSTPATAH